MHVLAKGLIVRSGGPELAQELEESGYVGLVGAELAGEDDSPAPVETPVDIDPFADPFA